MKAAIPFCLCILTLFAGCEMVGELLTFESSPSRTVVITEVQNENAAMSLNNIGPDQFILLTLLSNKNITSLTTDDITKVAFTVGKIENGKFEAKMVRVNLELWTGSGSYWTVFIMVDGKVKRAQLGYLSKEQHYIAPNQNYVYFTNLDFMGNVEMDIDLSDLPGKPFD
ncbi:MAG: hypothetical protein LBG72_00920 [Spirochaetaceae bacterium]|jgi:hypothetical protein|nr:hypothetical protein [Spirochaetaceae bacterium]